MTLQAYKRAVRYEDLLTQKVWKPQLVGDWEDPARSVIYACSVLTLRPGHLALFLCERQGLGFCGCSV